MPIELLALTMFVGLVGAVGLLRPALLFEYPVVASLVFAAFILPQCWQIEQAGTLADLGTGFVWVFMLVCMIALTIGYLVGRRRRRTTPQARQAGISGYNNQRLRNGGLILTVVGAISFILMAREAQNFVGVSGGWTGVITVYALLSGFLQYGATICWLVYLRTRDRLALACTGVGWTVALYLVLFAARRELAFSIAASAILGAFFVRRWVIPRIALIPLLLAGALLINQAGPIRAYLTSDKGDLVAALTTSAVEKNGERPAPEVTGAVYDIAASRWSGGYIFFANYYNTLVQLYFPAFVFGKEAKANAKLDVSNYVEEFGAGYTYIGATRTGFGSAFEDFHYFGAIVFFLLGLLLGRLWRHALKGSVVSQFYYIALLPIAVKVLSETTEIFIGALPALLVATVVLFHYSKEVSPKRLSYRPALPVGGRRLPLAH